MDVPDRCVYISVARQLMGSNQTVLLSESFAPDAAQVAVNLGRKMVERKPPPGWDDIHTEGWRAIKLPVHDLGGCTSFVVVFGGDFQPETAQALTERLALMLGPMVDGRIVDGDPGIQKRTQAEVLSCLLILYTPAMILETLQVMEADQSRLANQGQLRELDRAMAPMLSREIEQANSTSKIQALQDQVESIRGIMERNVEMILDRQVDLGHHLPRLCVQKRRTLQHWKCLSLHTANSRTSQLRTSSETSKRKRIGFVVEEEHSQIFQGSSAGGIS